MKDTEKMSAPTEEFVRSWTVVVRQGVPHLLGTRWVVGYTPGHKATKLEAIAYAHEVQVQKMNEVVETRALLERMFEDVGAAAKLDEPYDDGYSDLGTQVRVIDEVEIPTYEDGTPYFGRDLEEWQDNIERATKHD